MVTCYMDEEFQDDLKDRQRGYREKAIKNCLITCFSMSSFLIAFGFKLLLLLFIFIFFAYKHFHSLQLKQSEYENVKGVCLLFMMSPRLPEFGFQTMTLLGLPWHGLLEIFALKILASFLCLIYPIDASLIKMSSLSWPQMG